MPIALHCPTCGAGLDVEAGGTSLVQCPYCKASVTLPEVGRPAVPIPSRPEANTVVRPAKANSSGTRRVVATLVVASVAVAALAGAGAMVTSRSAGRTQDGYAELVLDVGGAGMGPAQFTDARDIAVDAAGNVYVADYQGGRVQMLDPKGKFVAQWNIGDREAIITGFAGDREGNLYVVTTKSFDKRQGRSGAVLQHYGTRYSDVTLSQDGHLVATAWAGDDFVVMDRAGKILTTVKDPVTAVTGLNRGYTFEDVTTDGQGNIYAVLDDEDAVFKFSSEGRYLNRYLGPGDAPEKLSNPHAIVVDGQGRMFVSDFRGVKVFDRDGVYKGLIETQGYVYGMVLTDGGELWTVGGDRARKWKLPK